ncbi:MAG: transposase [Gammaproteobacteria bacterium]|nr:transposase [Gammaproteobacteria bacterium]
MPKPGSRTTYKFSDEFKATAVRFSEIPGVQVQEVAASLYIHPFMLSRWRKQAREGLIVTRKVEIDRATAAELKVLRKVKRDYERLKLEHDILKNRSTGSPPPLCVETLVAYTGDAQGQWPTASWRFRPRQKTWPRGSCGPSCGGAFG